MTSQRKYQAGQAMTEFVVVAVLLLVPLYLIVPVLGKYIDMKSAAIQGARYAAWERTVFYAGAAASVDWPGVEKSDSQIRNEVRQRVFSEGAGIQNGDKSAGSWGGTGYKSNWHNRDGTGMLPNYDAVTQSLTANDTPGIANQALNLIVVVADALGPFNLEMKGLHAADVSVTANTQSINMSLNGDASMAFNPGPLTFSDHSVVLTNSWSANGSSHVKSQTQGLTPTGIFQTPVGKTLFTLLKVVAAVAAPEILFLDLGKIEPDVVPPDRLVTP